MLALLPLLAVADTPLRLGGTLFLFGASVGTVDVAMNIQAVLVEQHAGRSLMSAFHGFFSLGGIAGAAMMSGLLHAGASPLAACLAISAALALAFVASRRGLLASVDPTRPKAPTFAIPRGAVIAICIVCFASQMIEGSVIDWSAMFLTEERGVSPSLGGLGYVCFAAAMTLCRFVGDRLVNRLGRARVLAGGGACIALAFVLMTSTSSAALSAGSFALIGLGASNIVPILCSTSGRQQAMPPSHAIAAIVTFGYAGLMAGPAAIGFVAQQTSLDTAFLGLGALAALVALSSRIAR
jgi:predicted MFS family arabinose efflux permease